MWESHRLPLDSMMMRFGNSSRRSYRVQVRAERYEAFRGAPCLPIVVEAKDARRIEPKKIEPIYLMNHIMDGIVAAHINWIVPIALSFARSEARRTSGNHSLPLQ